MTQPSSIRSHYPHYAVHRRSSPGTTIQTSTKTTNYQRQPLRQCISHHHIRHPGRPRRVRCQKPHAPRLYPVNRRHTLSAKTAIPRTSPRAAATATAVNSNFCSPVPANKPTLQSTGWPIVRCKRSAHRPIQYPVIRPTTGGGNHDDALHFGRLTRAPSGGLHQQQYPNPAADVHRHHPWPAVMKTHRLCHDAGPRPALETR